MAFEAGRWGAPLTGCEVTKYPKKKGKRGHRDRRESIRGSWIGPGPENFNCGRALAECWHVVWDAGPALSRHLVTCVDPRFFWDLADVTTLNLIGDINPGKLKTLHPGLVQHWANPGWAFFREYKKVRTANHTQSCARFLSRLGCVRRSFMLHNQDDGHRQFSSDPDLLSRVKRECTATLTRPDHTDSPSLPILVINISWMVFDPICGNTVSIMVRIAKATMPYLCFRWEKSNI